MLAWSPSLVHPLHASHAYIAPMLTATFLGTGAATPTVDRNVAGLAVQREGETILFDCGEGNQRQMMRYGVGFSFTEIFFTHYHADHILGVTGLLRTMGLQDRTAPVTLYGPARRAAGPRRGHLARHRAQQVPGRDRARCGPATGSRASEYDIVVFETDHRADTVGYALAEHTRLGRFNPERARELGIPEGPLWGRLHKGETVVLEDGRSDRSGGPGRRAAPGTDAGLLAATRGPASRWSRPRAAPIC